MEPKNGQDMKSSQDQMMTTLEEAEDLTLYADETFDTDDVDLFEFTGEEDSPLTRLKLIVLSLDWEITDQILQELADEVKELGKLWEGDRVAQVYLQGLDKIGRYLRNEGAYAHPNAIKLLLTFFYDFEKIISSPDITGHEISALLKSDVRKFKILQYQISQTSLATEFAEPGEAEADQATTPEGLTPLQLLKASVLGLEWEVTDAGLAEFTQRLQSIEEACANDRSAQILIQGLKALGAYVTEEKANAHPESFTLLHSFYEGLEALLENGGLDSEQRQELLIDRVGRFNALKAAIAQAGTTVALGSGVNDVVDRVLEPQEEDEVEPPALEEEPTLELDEEPAPAGFDSSATETVAAMETAETPYPDDILDPSAIHPLTDEVADDFIEEELSIGTEISPALIDSDEELEFDEKLAASTLDSTPADEIEEQLDLIFPDSDMEELDEEAMAGESQESELSFTDDEMFAGLEDILSDDMEETGDQAVAELQAGTDEEEPPPAVAHVDDEEMPAALADADEEGGFDEDRVVAALDESPMEDLERKLDDFFGKSETAETTDQEEFEPAAPAGTDEDEATIAPALADVPDEGGFNEELVAGTIDEEALDIERKLDNFFGTSETAETTDQEEFEPAALAGTDEDEAAIAPALADVPDEEPVDKKEQVTGIIEETAVDIEAKLDAFFGQSDVEGPSVPEPSTAAPPVAEEEEAVPAAPAASIEEKLDTFFSGEGATEEPEPARETESTVAALAESVVLLAKHPTGEGLAAVSACLEGLNRQTLGPEQTVRLQLLDSAVNMLTSLSQPPTEDSLDLLDYLVTGMRDENQNPAGLAESVVRFTTWQRQILEEILKRQQEVRRQKPPELSLVSEEIRSAFTELRSSLTEELESLRRELREQ